MFTYRLKYKAQQCCQQIQWELKTEMLNNLTSVQKCCKIHKSQFPSTTWIMDPIWGPLPPQSHYFFSLVIISSNTFKNPFVIYASRVSLLHLFNYSLFFLKLNLLFCLLLDDSFFYSFLVKITKKHLLL